MKRCLLAMVILAISFLLFGEYTWQVGLVDTGGNGWQGAQLTVMVNGNPVLSNLTLANGFGPEYHSFYVKHGDQITTLYTPGQYSVQNGYGFLNQDGTIVLENGSEPTVAPTSISKPFLAEVLEMESYTIGDGTTPSILPVQPNWGFSYSQCIYLRSEFPAILPNTRITKLKYHWNGAVAAPHTMNWTIYMGHTTRTYFATTNDWEPLANMVKVFEGNVHLVPVNGWVEIMLDRPFEYDGSSNLVVATDENTPLYDQISGKFFATNVSNYRSMVYYDDLVNPDPADPPNISMRQTLVPNLILESSPYTYIPHTEDFSLPAITNSWTQDYTGTVNANLWEESNTANAGQEPWEMKATGVNALGLARLITPPVKLSPDYDTKVNFAYRFEPLGPDVTLKFQYSLDLNTWTTSWWQLEGSAGIQTGSATLQFLASSNEQIYFSLAVDGDLNDLSCAYMDDFSIVQYPQTDVEASMIITNEIVAEQSFVPRGTVFNNSTVSQSFYATFTLGNDDYLSVRSVSNLGPFQSLEIAFDPVDLNVGEVWPTRFSVHLAGDAVPENDQIASTIMRADLSSRIYGELYCNGPSYPGSLLLADPAQNETMPTSSNSAYLIGGDWVKGGWYCVSLDTGNMLWYDDFLYVDHDTGETITIGESGVGLEGMAYDPGTDKIYATSGSALYWLDQFSGLATLIGQHGNGVESMSGLAWDDDSHTLWGVDDVTDALYAMNTETGEVTWRGNLGINCSFFQDLVWDPNTGNLILISALDGGTQTSNIFLIDTYTGAAMLFTSFPTSYRLTGCAIPPQDLEVFFSGGILAWYDLARATIYNVWTSDDPNGPFLHQASTSNNWWRDPSFPQLARFYRVTAIINERMEPVLNHKTGIKDHNSGELLDPQPMEALNQFRRNAIQNTKTTEP
jgi:hypothetical protein